MFIEQAYKGDNAKWKVGITTILVMGIFILNFIAFLFTSQEDMDKMYEMLKSIPANINLILNLGVFIPILILLFILVKYLHNRSILSLTTSRSKFDFKRFAFSLSLILIFTIAGFFISYYLTPEDYVLQFDLTNFIILFVISLLMFPFQIGLEEWLFRGYLMQQLGVASKSKWFPLIVTSVLFGVFHSANPEVAEMGAITMVFYIGTGFLLGIMTLMDEGLEMALGFHLGNNFLAAVLVTTDYSALQTDAIFKSTAGSSSALEIIFPVLIIYPIFLGILAYRYKWTGWKEKLFGSVKEPESTKLEDNLVTD
ncbi:CPBP family intramembrane glutamic endopeptidase [Leeuwenhoekiella marinoflava]|uniref:CAAX prenyl protease 2/Lysostaphin resistance protein A-like domain-containing protein n=2 Tax=Leeuwenhoekiella marinoflava TaxID=988 RepID=A0A4V1KS23_9FLAO|nr:type II CAAX endopeptidase family protein [Leeuwenhoekiella marinoflava]RXG27033.1 hypothetical protein DSL99_3087 [Leeuwenhoekiella marinoflava]SHF42520.1 hypothetical protein SAMN02745246_02482 [Leeuwenhoekiella marinoflava DSM 3653]